MRLRQTAKGDKLPSDWGFRLMDLEFKIRDFVRPRRNIFKEVGIKPGYRVLDYGCGPGSYVKPVADLVGDEGKVYALDAHPLAIKMVKGIVARKHLKNVETILSECQTSLPNNSLDVGLSPMLSGKIDEGIFQSSLCHMCVSHPSICIIRLSCYDKNVELFNAQCSQGGFRMKKAFEFLAIIIEKIHQPKNESSNKAAKLYFCPICHEYHY